MYAYIYVCPCVSLHAHMLCSLHAYYLDDMLFEGYPRLALFTCVISLQPEHISNLSNTIVSLTSFSFSYLNIKYYTNYYVQ